MLRKILILGLFVSFLTMSSAVFAEDVMVTARGSKYHKPECRFVQDKENVTTLSKEEAIEAGYGPCGRCYKEDKVVDKEDSEEK